MELDVPAGILAAQRFEQAPDPADAVAIGNLLQAYAVFTDQGYRAELAALFLDDASWEGVELGYGVAHGPADIAELVLSHYHPGRPAVHLPGPPLLVRIDADTVESFSWCVATRYVDGVTAPTIYFSYDDVIRRTPDGWRFASRHLRLRFRG